MSGLQDLLKGSEETRAQMIGDFNPGKYRGVLSHITQIKSNIEEDRGHFLQNEHELRQKLAASESHSKVVQKQLTQQITVVNSGYSKLVEDHQKLTEAQRKW